MPHPPVLEPLAFPGFAVGHASDARARSGVSVLLFDHPCPAAADICGAATSTRQFDGLRPDHMVPGIDALVFSGGSAFGLDAGGGAAAWLEARGRGLPTAHGRVPVVPTAALYDLGFGPGPRPDYRRLAALACSAARRDGTPLGSVGAGTGATVGKLFGRPRAMKGGWGAATARRGSAMAQAFAAVNAFGDVRDLETGVLIAGARVSETGRELADTVRAAAAGLPATFAAPAPGGALTEGLNTVLIAVVVNAALDKAGCARLARAARAGLLAAVSPALSPFDGDLLVAVSAGELRAEEEALHAAGAEAVGRAIVAAVQCADGFGLTPAAGEGEGRR